MSTRQTVAGYVLGLCLMTESRVDDMHPSWYPRVLKELETRYPKIFQEITSDAVIRNAQEQVAKANRPC